MGQYYRALLTIKDKTTVYPTYIDGEYMFAKLTEHSWWNNHYVLAVASKMFRTKCRLAWVGDYADKEDKYWNDIFDNAWGENEELCAPNKKLKYNGFTLDCNKYFINYDKKEFIDLEEYRKLSEDISRDGWAMNPVSLLTACGNGNGGGDYKYGGSINIDKIGKWCYDLVEITDKEIFDGIWNREKEEREWILKPEFADFKDVTKETIFCEEPKEGI